MPPFNLDFDNKKDPKLTIMTITPSYQTAKLVNWSVVSNDG